MKAKIENPKIFISYAWGDKENQNRVLSFASSLMSDGIDVIIDKWNLREGNDKYAFMEKSVTDSSVTNVLILLDPLYASKADTKEGGVGTETQIISPEIYEKTAQTKFLPVVFSRNEDGAIPKPIFLRGTVHFDLSQDDSYDEEYQRLVKTLYGVEIYKKPELGKKPEWVEKETEISAAKRITKNLEIKKILAENDRLIVFKEKLCVLKQEMLEYSFKSGVTEYVEMYDELGNIRNDFLALFKMLPYAPNSISSIADSFEDILFEEKRNEYTAESMMKLTLLHELFIYLVIICFKNELYKELGYLLNRSYYSGKYNKELESFVIFRSQNDLLDKAICEQDGKKYHSGTANYWIEKINIDICSKGEFAFADVLCFNVSIFQHQDYMDWYWFPLTYVYMGNEYESVFKKFAVGLKSKEKLKKASVIFGYDNTEDFIKRFKEINEDRQLVNEYRNCRYSSAFDSPQTLFQFVNIADIGVKY